MWLQRMSKVHRMIAVAGLLVVLTLQTVHSGTTGKIAGIVIGAESGEPLPGVNIEIVGTALGGASDLDGEYYIISIPPGVYDVKASMIGYKTLIQKAVKVFSDRTIQVNFKLDETVMELGEVVEVVAQRPLVEQDETSTRHFVQAEEISSRPATQLTQILMTLPSIDQGAGGELLVRRGSLDQVAFLIDGMRARNPLDFRPYTGINLSSIEELEIITGGFNAEYGEAQSGVFNIVTKEGSNRLTGYGEFRWTPAGKHHWGTEFYDYSTERYWENTHARHLQWWIDNPDQWVDKNGLYGNDPACAFTPEQAYDDYMNTHQPLTDYTDRQGYLGEISMGGPTPLKNLNFFVSAKYRTQPPITGNVYRKYGEWFDGTAKLTYSLNEKQRLMMSGFFNVTHSIQGMEYMDMDWIGDYGLKSKYAYYDFAGYPIQKTNGQTLKFSHYVSNSTFYDIQLSRIYYFREQSTFPNDTNGWEEGDVITDGLKGKDENGNLILEANRNVIGLHTTGYFYRGYDKNTDLTLSGDWTSQLTKRWLFKSGGDLTYYTLDRFQEAKAFSVIEKEVYHPWEGNLYTQSKLEFQGLIMNIGLRWDFYNPNSDVFLDPFDPYDAVGEDDQSHTPEPATKRTETKGQLSPRLGISHPISEKTVLHFSYGHFFQRASFGDYGEGYDVYGILNTFVQVTESGLIIPHNLGNRDLEPRKTVAYELGIEHNIADIVLGVTAFYKDITNTVRSVTVYTESGGRYLTSGNGDYGDAKGVEIQLRKPFSGYWGGYLNYTWSTGIYGRSGDPDVIVPPNSEVQTRYYYDIGDAIEYDPVRLKFGIVLGTPDDFRPVFGMLSNLQVSLDYQIYFPHSRIPSDVFTGGGKQYERPADKNADIRIRREFSWRGIRPSIFVEVRNVFNDKWINVNAVKSASTEDRVRFINSGFSDFPEKEVDGSPFPDIIKYRNLPRLIMFGFALGL